MSTPKMKTARRTGSGFTSPLLPTPTQIANIHRILRCGILPLNSSSLRGTVSLAKTELAHYDAEIAKLQTELDRLASERALLLSYSASCQSVLSARQRLPNELLAFIFELSFPHGRYRLDDYATGTVERLRLSHHHILQLGQVSSRWHRIAMETPMLWSTVTIDTSLWARYNSTRMLQLLESSLRRSRDHALDLHLKFDTRPHDNSGYNESLFQLLAKTAYRWRHARIVWHRKPPNSIPRILGNLEKLETLEVDLGWRMIDTVEAPCLRHFSFHGNMDHLPSLPWHQLQSCRYRGEDFSPSLSPLSLLPTANESTAFTFTFNLYLVPDDEISVSSNIQSVEFLLNTGDKPGSVEKLLDCLTFPCLTAFKYRPMPPNAYMATPNWSSPRFLALADCSSFATHLIHLTIHAKITEDELLLNVKALNCLEELSVMDSFTDPLDKHVVVTDKLLQGLLYIPGKVSLVPKLRVLTFKTVMEFTDSVYFDLVVSRIEKVHVVDGSGAFSANIRRYKGSRKLGFSTQHKFKSFVSDRTLLFQYVEMEV